MRERGRERGATASEGGARSTQMVQKWRKEWFNFPENWEVVNLWRTFKRYGDISDLYMARKRMKNGQNFGFARFNNMTDEKLMEKKLGGIWIGSFKLRVYLENGGTRRISSENVWRRKDSGDSERTKFRSYREALKK